MIKVAYDGELLDIEDAWYRIERDEELQEKYEQAVEDRDDEQYSFDDIDDLMDGDFNYD